MPFFGDSYLGWLENPLKIHPEKCVDGMYISRVVYKYRSRSPSPLRSGFWISLARHSADLRSMDPLFAFHLAAGRSDRDTEMIALI